MSFPDQSELVIGLVGAVGVDLSLIVDELRDVLTAFQYETIDIHLTDALAELDWSKNELVPPCWDLQLCEEPVDKRIWSYMDAGNALRTSWARDDAFALLAVNAIRTHRHRVGGSRTTPLSRRAYVLRSLKRRDEVKMLRNVYGSRFVQISVYSPRSERETQLRKLITRSRPFPSPREPEHSVDEILDRDLDEAQAHGQEVEKVFHGGDFFVREIGARDELQRVTEILFGHPNRTPTKDETGMFHAVAAALRSAELGRQVGAAICDDRGSLIAVGYNDVPKAGGGLYDDEDSHDSREFKNPEGFDTNDRKKRQLAESVAAELVGAKDLEQADLSSHFSALVKVLANSAIDDLIEFMRAVHAEMAAISDAVRRGVSVEGGVLYATTFPCHHCARHIVAAGIDKVVYIEPYPKSLAADLHSDSIVVDPKAEPIPQRVAFVPFVGVGPRRYLELFRMPERKDKTSGEVKKFDPATALPRIDAIEDDEMVPKSEAHIRRENRAIEILWVRQEERGPAFRSEQPSKSGDPDGPAV